MMTSGSAPQLSLDPDDRLLIIGAGLAGYHTARGARLNGHQGQITILGAEHRLAYDRPALSKAYLTGAVSEDDLALDDPDQPLDAQWVPGADVIALSAVPLGVHTLTGEFWAADAVVIATGAGARTLPQTNPDDEVARPYLLRSMDDAAALRATCLQGLGVAVVGGGFLALEAAATCTQRGAESVTVIAGEQHPGATRLGTPVGRALRSVHEAHGVRFASAARAVSVTSTTAGHTVHLADGSAVAADVAILACGAVPATGWLQGGPLHLSPAGAVLCDDFGATGIAGVWAAGDCAEWASQSKGLRPVGHWQEALEQAAVVAAHLTGAEPQPMQEPYFWSDQYDLRLQGAGRIAAADEVRVLEGSAETGDLLISYLRGGTEVGILGFNRLREVKRWRKQHQIRKAQTVAA
ncbi:NAD(P)/FAD-dependent oxidoreductase [Nesterenkonia ebinurensis]|uniref:NAD(P)/FAD-dependent oxidoreductase n=1 Tax=Nesterenkonia ebinurensis TaxID=2608252 RepID=UPI00123D5661|nr:FAD/NAD(P)-binding oxidoreductase [Nesterenkonia ebinurensis]